MRHSSDRARLEGSKVRRSGGRGLFIPLAVLVLISILSIGLTGCVFSSNQSPNCFISASPNFGNAPLEVTFTMTADDVDGYIASWSLDVNGDGDPDYSGDGGPPQTLQHTYETSIATIAELRVKDDDGASSKDGVSVTVL